MKTFAAIITTLALAGCSQGFLESHSTGFTEKSKKSAQDYVQCLEPKWQAPATSISKIKTRTGYSLEISSTHIGPIALAVVTEENPGINVDVFLPTAQGRAERWEDAARACL
ncbi:hypothetical protein [Pseudomonas sp. NPDC089569]|uniref:hypothetical protein n=1 Tax=Pseudomonas sp. NPDC089569 TaxID=3390722 RepID=UPI003D0790A2